MTCPFCGAINEKTSLFCISCGNKLENEETDEMTVAFDEETDGMTVAFDEETDTQTSVADDADEASGESDQDAAFDESEERSTQEEANEAEEGYSLENALSDAEEMPNENSDILDEASEDAPSEDAEQPEEPADQLPEAAASTSGSNDKLSWAVVLLSAALFAIVGFLFIDKILSLKPADSRATTIRIVSQSEDITVKPGTLTEFFVDAQGTNLTYQWYVKKSGEQLWHAWKSHNDPKTASKANESWDGMQVYCMIIDNNRTSLASEIITVTIEKK